MEDHQLLGEPLDCGGCPLASLELAPANIPAWEAYLAVADQWRPGPMGGMGPLDMAGVVAVLNHLELTPPTPETRREMLDKLRIIHAVRMELASRERNSKDQNRS